MPPKIKDKFARQKISRSLASYRRKQDALKQNGEAKRTSEMFAAEKLQPLIEWIAKNPGSKRGKPSNAPDYVQGPHSRIQAEFAKFSKAIPTGPELQRWLNPDEGARTQCRYGVGVILELVGKVLNGKES